MITPDQEKFIKGIIKGIYPGTIFLRTEMDEYMRLAFEHARDVLAELKSGDEKL